MRMTLGTAHVSTYFLLFCGFYWERSGFRGFQQEHLYTYTAFFLTANSVCVNELVALGTCWVKSDYLLNFKFLNHEFWAMGGNFIPIITSFFPQLKKRSIPRGVLKLDCLFQVHTDSSAGIDSYRILEFKGQVVLELGVQQGE